MNCCKSNDAVVTSTPQTQPPKVESKNESSPKEQAPSSSPDKSYRNFLQPSIDQSPTPAPTFESESNIDIDTNNSVEKYLIHNNTSEEVDDMVKDLPNIQTTSVEPPPVIKATSSDDITTVYEEPPKVPKGSYVYLPNVPQRGYEAWGTVVYAFKDEWLKNKPYRIGTMVWYRNHTDPGEHPRKFKWYIPGVIEDYVWSENDKNEVAAYKIKIEASAMRKMDQYFLDKLNNAEPENVMLRWNNEIPPCPVDGIDESVPKRDAEERLTELVEEYGEDLGFQGAKQNGLG